MGHLHAAGTCMSNLPSELGASSPHRQSVSPDSTRKRVKTEGPNGKGKGDEDMAEDELCLGSMQYYGAEVETEERPSQVTLNTRAALRQSHRVSFLGGSRPRQAPHAASHFPHIKERRVVLCRAVHDALVGSMKSVHPKNFFFCCWGIKHEACHTEK